MSKAAAILNPDLLPAKDRGGGIRTIPLVTARIGSTSLLNGVTTLDPGARYVFCSGQLGIGRHRLMVGTI